MAAQKKDNKKVKAGKPLVDGVFLLEKFPGKGGWTYARVPGVIQDKNNPFGWVKVRGSIDDHELNHYKLMPMGDGKLFLPVKAEVRKKIKKAAGDHVRVILYRDDSPLEIPDEIRECFKYEPKELLDNFLSLTQGEQKAYLDWIYNAKSENTKANRILEMMNRLQRRLRLHDEMN